jgi:hypothetical protein
MPSFSRFIRGMTDHFRLRAPAWIMSLILFGLGTALLKNPNVFTHDVKAYQYVFLNRVFDQTVWAILCVTVGGARIVALIINGTFRSFPWSNHIRSIGAFLSCFLWFQIALGVWTEGFLDGWNTAMPIYCGLLLFDVLNTYSAALEIDPSPPR